MKFISQVKRMSAQTLNKVSVKLKSRKGNGELTGLIIGVLIAVVIGAILLGLFGDQIKATMGTIGDRIEEMFNYE